MYCTQSCKQCFDRCSQPLPLFLENRPRLFTDVLILLLSVPKVPKHAIRPHIYIVHARIIIRMRNLRNCTVLLVLSQPKNFNGRKEEPIVHTLTESSPLCVQIWLVYRSLLSLSPSSTGWSYAAIGFSYGTKACAKNQPHAHTAGVPGEIRSTKETCYLRRFDEQSGRHQELAKR